MTTGRATDTWLQDICINIQFTHFHPIHRYSFTMYSTVWSHLSNSSSLNRVCLHLGEVVVICYDVSDDRFLIWVLNVHIWNAWQHQKPGHCDLFNWSKSPKPPTSGLEQAFSNQPSFTTLGLLVNWFEIKMRVIGRRTCIIKTCGERMSRHQAGTIYVHKQWPANQVGQSVYWH